MFSSSHPRSAASVRTAFRRSSIKYSNWVLNSAGLPSGPAALFAAMLRMVLCISKIVLSFQGCLFVSL